MDAPCGQAAFEMREWQLRLERLSGEPAKGWRPAQARVGAWRVARRMVRLVAQ